MTQENKELLLEDLCARLPYGLKYNYGGYDGCDYTMNRIDCNEVDCAFPIENVKPYLFSLSSMTDKQAKEIQEIVGNPDNACIIRKTDGLELWLDSIDTDPTIWVDTIFEIQDYLNKNHFDYRDLIKKGLAIDATGLNIY